jgi:MYXO-CTERM domain-containing protein
MDVDFADVNGTIHKITTFGVRLTRDRDFEAGEYELTVKLSEGGTLGRPQRITLKGNNKVIDRRAMVFGGEVSSKKGNNTAKAQPTADDKPKAAEEYSPDLSDIEDISDKEASQIDDPNAPPSEDPRQGGCGCRVVGTEGAAGAGGVIVALTLLTALGARRRRAQRGLASGPELR